MISRYIYVYCEAASDKPLYVGSAFNTARRDKEHCNNTGLPIDREIAKRGRSAFTFTVLDSVTALTVTAAMKVAMTLENNWMDVLRTYRTEGCFNFGRASIQYDSEEKRQASRAARAAVVSKPEWRAHHSAVLKIAHNRPESKARQAAATRIIMNDASAKERHRKIMEAVNNRPEALANQSIVALKNCHIRWHVKRGIVSPTCKLCAVNLRVQ